jgi:hypothetical protein
MRSLSCDRCTYCFAPSRLAAVLELPQQIVDRLPCVGVVVFDDIRVTVSNPKTHKRFMRNSIYTARRL